MTRFALLPFLSRTLALSRSRALTPPPLVSETQCFKVNNANGDVTIMEKTKPKKGKKVKVTKFMLRSIPADK